MNDDTDIIAFPELPDEAVAALDQFLEAFYDHFQNHYFAQMHRYYHASTNASNTTIPFRLRRAKTSRPDPPPK
ncbi:MAG: hypothetical protein ACYC18_08820 [Gammaproteobacteria bacterium]